MNGVSDKTFADAWFTAYQHRHVRSCRPVGFLVQLARVQPRKWCRRQSAVRACLHLSYTPLRAPLPDRVTGWRPTIVSVHAVPVYREDAKGE